MVENISKVVGLFLLLPMVLGAEPLVVKLHSGITLSDLVGQGVDVRHRIPRGRQASFLAEDVYFSSPDGFGIRLRKGECIIEFFPDQTVWYLNYYERVFTDQNLLEEQLQNIYEGPVGSGKAKVKYDSDLGLSIRGEEIHQRVAKIHPQPSNERRGWLHFFFCPKKLGSQEVIRYSLLDAEILPPFEFPNHDMTPTGYFPGSKSKKRKPTSEGWRSPAQPGESGKRVRDGADSELAEVPKKNPSWWVILAIVTLGSVWLLLKRLPDRGIKKDR